MENYQYKPIKNCWYLNLKKCIFNIQQIGMINKITYMKKIY